MLLTLVNYKFCLILAPKPQKKKYLSKDFPLTEIYNYLENVWGRPVRSW